ncbi:MAG: SpoIVB peptidase [Limnochordia bacterium]
MQRHKKLVYLWYLLAVGLLFVALQVQVLNSLPHHLRLIPGETFNFQLSSPYSLVPPLDKDFIQVSEEGVEISPTGPDSASLQINLWGVPIREMLVEVVPQLEVMPGGQAVGVLLAPGGLIVVDHVPLMGSDGRDHFPAREADIRPGDIIMSLGGAKISSPEQVRALVEEFGRRGQPMAVELLRDGRTIHTQITPVEVHRDHWAGRPEANYLLGLWLEDPAAGVGTLTFYEPKSGAYGALGHMVTDGASRPLQIGKGRIVRAHISGIQSGQRGRPGEKIGVFQDERDIVGTIEKNTRFGIFGHLQIRPANPYFPQPIPVAMAHQVEVGPAEIYTVLDGQQVERFTVEIAKVNYQSRPNDKGLIIQITDPELLRRTGGIVQGMSGSPIVQNGRLVGAVTHVFVSDPTRGFGVLAEWMIYEAGLEITDAA